MGLKKIFDENVWITGVYHQPADLISEETTEDEETSDSTEPSDDNDDSESDTVPSVVW